MTILTSVQRRSPITARALALVAGLGSALVLGLWPATGAAVPSYSGSLEATSRILDVLDPATGASLLGPNGELPNGLEIIVGTAADLFTDTAGSGIASGSAAGTGVTGGSPAGPVPGRPTDSLATLPGEVVQRGEVSGSVPGGPGSGFALSDLITDGVFRIINQTGGEVAIAFSLDYSWSIGVAVDDPVHEYAEVSVDLIGGLADLTDPDEVIIFLELFFDGFLVDSDFDPFDFDVFSNSIGAAAPVPDGTTVDVALFADIFGFAESVPLPGTVPLLCVGLAGLALGRRAARQA